MKRRSVAAALAAILLALPAHAEGAADFFRADLERRGLSGASGAPARVALPPHRSGVAKAVHARASARLGPRWGDFAVRLSKIESGHRCHVLGPRTRSGRAVGPLQIMPRSAAGLGFTDVKRLHRDCAYQIAAGVAHMERCLAAGAATPRLMAACHVAGWHGFQRRLNPRAQAYKRAYVRLAMGRE
jgi:hypothetical protein